MLLMKRLIGLKHLRSVGAGDSSSMSNNVILSYLRNYSSSTIEITPEHSKLFFSAKVQELLKAVIGLELEKVYRSRAVGEDVQPPKYAFMTNEQLKEAQTNAIRKAYLKLQMPPVVPIKKEEIEILEETKEMIGFTTSKYVFTDISYTVSDKERWIVVREPSGVLRKALPFERHRMNQLYFEKEGRSYLHPAMFKEENLKRLCDEGQYEYILDRAVCQYEPDDAEYHRVTSYTFEKVNENKDFNKLRSTRHFGILVFYLCLKKDLVKLLEEMLETDRLSDAVKVVQLYSIIYPTSEFSSLELNPEHEAQYLKKFLEIEIIQRAKLLQLLNTYWQAHEKNVEFPAEN